MYFTTILTHDRHNLSTNLLIFSTYHRYGVTGGNEIWEYCTHNGYKMFTQCERTNHLILKTCGMRSLMRSFVFEVCTYDLDVKT